MADLTYAQLPDDAILVPSVVNDLELLGSKILNLLNEGRELVAQSVSALDESNIGKIYIQLPPIPPTVDENGIETDPGRPAGTYKLAEVGDLAGVQQRVQLIQSIIDMFEQAQGSNPALETSIRQSGSRWRKKGTTLPPTAF